MLNEKEKKMITNLKDDLDQQKELNKLEHEHNLELEKLRHFQEEILCKQLEIREKYKEKLSSIELKIQELKDEKIELLQQEYQEIEQISEQYKF